MRWLNTRRGRKNDALPLLENRHVREIHVCMVDAFRGQRNGFPVKREFVAATIDHEFQRSPGHEGSHVKRKFTRIGNFLIVDDFEPIARTNSSLRCRPTGRDANDLEPATRCIRIAAGAKFESQEMPTRKSIGLVHSARVWHVEPKSSTFILPTTNKYVQS
jgi:hypothetical protein